MSPKSNRTPATAAKTPKLKKETARDLTAKQAGSVKGGAIKRLGRTRT